MNTLSLYGFPTISFILRTEAYITCNSPCRKMVELETAGNAHRCTNTLHLCDPVKEGYMILHRHMPSMSYTQYNACR